MKPGELFGVIIRTIGLVLILDGIQIAANLQLGPILAGMVFAVIGFLLLAGADKIVRLCYSKEPRES